MCVCACVRVGEIESSEDAKQRASSVPTLPPGDWMRRGLLAERLYHDSEALLAYRCVESAKAHSGTLLIL